MTAPNLTPAEALECLRDRRAVDRAELSSSAFYDRWGTFDSALWRAIDALERLANEAKEPAAAVPSGYVPSEHERRCAEEVAGWPEWKRRAAAGSWCSPGPEPAAAVPSDEEITSALRRWRFHGSVDGRMECMENAILLILQRIGVKL